MNQIPNPKPAIVILARSIVGGVLIYAGFIKAAGPAAEFAAAIAAYKILPAAFVMPFALGIPYIEMWIGLFVLTGFYTRRASLFAAVLFTIFLAVLGSAMARGIDLYSCGCFGADSLPPRYTFLLDLTLLGLSLAIFRLVKSPQPLSLDRALS